MANLVDHPSHASVLLVIPVLVALNATVDLPFGSNWYDQHRISQIALLVVVGLAIALARLETRPVVPASLRLALVAVLSVGLVSAILAIRPDAALVEWATLSLILLFVATTPVLNARCLATAGAAMFFVPVGAFAVACTARYFSALVAGSPGAIEVILVGFDNPRFVGQMLLLCLPFAPLALHLAQDEWVKRVVWWVALTGWMLVFASGSRTAWLGLFVAAGVLFFAAQSSAWLRQQVKWAVGGFVGFALLFVLFPSIVGNQAAVSADRLLNAGSVLERFKLWRIAADMAMAQPLFGVGPMHFSYDNNGLGAHPHNFWLQLGAEWGLATMLLLGGLAVFLFGKLVCLVHAGSRGGARAAAPNALVCHSALAALTAWGVGTQTDGLMVIPSSQLLSAAVLAFAVASLACAGPLPKTERVSEWSPSLSLVAWSRRLLAVFGTAILLALPFSEFGSPAQREERWREVKPAAKLWPRFWLMGWIGPSDDPTAGQP